MRGASPRPTPRVFFFGVDSLWMMDGSSVLPFPLMFGLGIIPPLSVAVLGGFCCNLVGGAGGGVVSRCDERQSVGVGSALRSDSQAQVHRGRGEVAPA